MVVYKLDCYKDCNSANNNILFNENNNFLALARDPEWGECPDVVEGICSSKSIKMNELTVKSCNKGSMADWFILYKTRRGVISLIIECKINWTPNIKELLDSNSDFIKQLAAKTIINLLSISESCIEKNITRVRFILVLGNELLNRIRKVKFRDGSEKIEEEILTRIRQKISNINNLSIEFELCKGNQQTITCDDNFKLNIPCC